MVASTVVEPSRTEPSDPAGTLQAAASLLAVVADPNRLALLGVLTGGTTCVCELQGRVPIAANLLSYHLRVLREAGLVTTARRGRWVDYTLAGDALARLHAALPGAAHGDPAGGAR